MAISLTRSLGWGVVMMRLLGLGDLAEDLLEALDELGIAWDVRITKATDVPRILRKAQDDGRRVGQDPDWYEGGNREFAYLHRSLSGAEASNRRLRVDISDDNGALTVTDLRSKQTWRQVWVEDDPAYAC